MRTLLISAFMSFVVSLSWANEKLYNKLNKLYLTDRNKCIEKSKKITTKNSSEAIPYYFISVIHYDKSKESKSLKGMYSQMSRSIINASKFEKYSGDQERDLVHWDEHTASLHNRADKLISALDKNEMQDLSQKLIGQLSKVGSLAKYYPQIDNIDIIDKDQITKSGNETSLNSDFIKIEGHFYGIPTGNERVESIKLKENEMLKLINDERAKRHIPALVWNEELANASRYHAFDQGTQEYFSHVSNDKINGNLVKVGSTFDRIRKFYKGSPIGECIAAGNENSTKTFDQWLKSEHHAKIILDANARFVGIGLVQVENSPHGYYWVLATGE